MANETARTLRKRLTPQEVKMWVKLRELKILGFHFRRQTLIGPYIVDFVSLGGRIVIEIDGGQHALWKAFARTRSATGFFGREAFVSYATGIQMRTKI